MMPVNLTADNQATDTLPTPSPDGKWLAYAAMARPGYEADRLVLMLRNLESGETKKLTDACKTKSVCPYTGTAQPQYRLEGMKITAEFKQRDEELLPEGGERKVVVTAERALQILKAISDEDCRALGLDPEHARPDWFILQVMPVPPRRVPDFAPLPVLTDNSGLFQSWQAGRGHFHNQLSIVPVPAAP